MRVRPKILIDLKKPNNGGVFSNKNLRLDLRRKEFVKVPVFKFIKISALIAVCFYLIFGSALAPIEHGQQSLAAQSDDERKQLEEQLKSLESQIDQYQETIDQYRSQGKNLESEIKRLDAKVAKLNLQLKATVLSLKKLGGEIEINQNKIKQTEVDIEKNKRILSNALQDLYSSGNINLIEVFLKNFDLSDFFDDIKNLTDIQDNLRLTLEKVIVLKEELMDEKEQLAIKKNDIDSLRTYQLSQKKSVDDTKTEKDDLLKATKGQESKYQDLLKQTQKTAAEIRSRIFKLLGGGELTFEEAYKLAKLAEKATGVRAAFILAVLTQESGESDLIGKNLGKCKYDQEWSKNPEKRVMRLREASIFEVLMAGLGLDPKSSPVSCPISRDGLYGGAMGPAQFMPSTWNLYSDRIGKITGNNPPSPFNNGDAFVGTALYLKDAGAANASLAQERIAAARYYAGGNWRYYLNKYGDPVVSRAQDYQKDIDILNS